MLLLGVDYMRLWISVIALAAAASAWAQTGGRVEVSYRLERIGGIASNQLAVWIEDEAGAHVRTLFVTDFTARRKGFQRRPQCLPTWVRTAGVAGWKTAEIDAVSGATQKPGRVTVVWDCTDTQKRRVPDGVYVYRVEGNLRWENTVLWTGRVRVGPSADSSRAEARHQPAGAEKTGVLVAEVGASFRP
jgi:hypothetical protein